MSQGWVGWEEESEGERKALKVIEVRLERVRGKEGGSRISCELTFNFCLTGDATW